MTNDDPLDIAYLAIGAADALARIMRTSKTGEWPDALDGYGQDGVIQHVIESADLLRKAWDSLPGGEWNGGVWYYEISEVLGSWIIRQWVNNNDSPSTQEIEAEIKRLMHSSQGH